MATPSTSALDATIEITPGSATWKTSQQLALNLSGGSQLTSHEQELLRVRLRVASLVLFIGCSLFLVMWVFGLSEMMSNPFLKASHLITTATLGMCAFSLCRSCHPSQFKLRVQEAIVFGMPAAFFAFVNITSLQACAATHRYLPDPFSPWIVLVFTYALFIPNRLWRAVLVILSMAFTPVIILGVMMAVSSVCQQAHNADAVFLMKGFLIMTMTSIIAATGAAKIGTLRKEAFTAKELGQYRLKEQIGRGGMGEVYLAEHRLIKRPCAVKLIRRDRAQDPQAIARFEREVQTAANLTHWNSVNVYDYGHAEDGTFYFVMEYLRGMSLQQLVEEHGALPASRTIYFLRQICSALQEAHDMQCVHRDLKPANIFAARLGGEHDVAKLLDFGLAKELNSVDSTELTMLGSIAGSPLFMAPETATGDSEPDARSDIYSLGCVAYYLLTGHPPFPGDQPIKILMAHANQAVGRPSERNAGIPADLERIVLQCLEKNPADRPQSADELEVSLRQCADASEWSRSAANAWWANVQTDGATATEGKDLARTIA